jgi:hypothetical protein
MHRGLLCLLAATLIASCGPLPISIVRATPTPAYVAAVQGLRRDFDALTATIRDAVSTDTALRAVLLVNTDTPDRLDQRRRTLADAIDKLPDATSAGRAYLRTSTAQLAIAINLLRWRPPYPQMETIRLGIRDALNTAEAEWLKGEDALR